MADTMRLFGAKFVTVEPARDGWPRESVVCKCGWESAPRRNHVDARREWERHATVVHGPIVIDGDEEP